MQVANFNIKIIFKIILTSIKIILKTKEYNLLVSVIIIKIDHNKNNKVCLGQECYEEKKTNPTSLSHSHSPTQLVF